MSASSRYACAACVAQTRQRVTPGRARAGSGRRPAGARPGECRSLTRGQEARRPGGRPPGRRGCRQRTHSSPARPGREHVT